MSPLAQRSEASAMRLSHDYRFPFPPYADGWFQVAYSDELAAGDVLPLKYFGRDLVVFRTESGRACVLDAHCPHLGAHLGHGGCVVGESISCPFHAWKFDGDGQCTDVPYASKIPKKAGLGAWPVVEANGLVMVWHHGAGEAPSWAPPAVAEHENDAWTPYEKRRWQIRTHNQEMAENAVDSAHFLYLHGTQEMPESHAVADGPLLHVRSKTVAKAYGQRVSGEIDVRCWGFGFTTTRFTGIVETLLVSSVTPIDDTTVDVRFTFTVKKGPTDQVTSIVGDKYRAEIERQLEADIPIWENKKYIHPPALCEGDGPIGIYRKWARQFYTMDMPPRLGA